MAVDIDRAWAIFVDWFAEHGTVDANPATGLVVSSSSNTAWIRITRDDLAQLLA